MAAIRKYVNPKMTHKITTSKNNTKISEMKSSKDSILPITIGCRKEQTEKPRQYNPKQGANEKSPTP